MIGSSKIKTVAILLICQFGTFSAAFAGTVTGTGYSYRTAYDDSSICSDEQILNEAKAEAFSFAEKDGYHNCNQWLGHVEGASNKVECNKHKDGYYSLKINCVAYFYCGPY